MVDEADRIKGAVLVLVRCDPRRCLVQQVLIDVHEFLGFGECFQDKGRQPQTSFIVALSKGRKAAVVAPVGELPLVPGDHQFLRLGHYLWLELSALLQVLGDVHVGGKHHHILLAAAEGHLDKLLQALHGLRQEAGGHSQVHSA